MSIKFKLDLQLFGGQEIAKEAKLLFGNLCHLHHSFLWDVNSVGTSAAFYAKQKRPAKSEALT